MIPGRSLSAKTSDCSTVPVANTSCAGADLVQRVALPDGDEPVEAAERGGAGEDLDARGARLRDQLGGALVAALVEQPPARHRALVGQHDVGAQLGGGDRRAQARRAAADHEHVGVAAAVLGAPLALVLAACAAARAPRRGAAPSRTPATAAAGG